MYRSQTIGTSEMREIDSGSAEILPGECLSDVHGVTESVGCDRETRLICHLLHGTYRSFGDIYVSSMYHVCIIVYRTYGEWVHLDPGYSMFGLASRGYGGLLPTRSNLNSGGVHEFLLVPHITHFKIHLNIIKYFNLNNFLLKNI